MSSHTYKSKFNLLQWSVTIILLFTLMGGGKVNAERLYKFEKKYTKTYTWNTGNASRDAGYNNGKIYVIENIASPAMRVINAATGDEITGEKISNALFNSFSVTSDKNGALYVPSGNTGGGSLFGLTKVALPRTVTNLKATIGEASNRADFMEAYKVDVNTTLIAAATSAGGGNLRVWTVTDGVVSDPVKFLEAPTNTAADVKFIAANKVVMTARGLKPAILTLNMTAATFTQETVATPANATVGGSAYFKVYDVPYLVVDGGANGPFIVYDISTPASPKKVAEETASIGSTSNGSYHNGFEAIVKAAGESSTVVEIYVFSPNNGLTKHELTIEKPSNRTFTVEVPQGTENVYIAGSFLGKEWKINADDEPYQLTKKSDSPLVFEGSFMCYENIQYKYLCHTGDWDYQEASISNGNLTSNPNRTYNTSDVVTHWFASPKVTLNVSFASGVNTPDNLFAKGDWDSWAAGKAITKSGDTYSITINQKTYANTKYKYYTNDPSNDNWEANADNSDRDNRWAISPTMNDQIVKFKTDIQAKVAIPTFSPAPGTYDEINSLELTVSSTTSGAAFRYTTNGTNPTTSSPIAGNGKVTLTPGTYTVKVLAVKDGMKNSDIASASYTVVAPILRSKTFTVTVPEGTENVYIAGTFPAEGMNWNKGESAYKLTRQGTSNTFTGTFECYNSLEYKYLCHNAGDNWDYGEAIAPLQIDTEGKPTGGANRTYNENDVVEFWVAMPKFSVNVTIDEGIEDVENLYINGDWTKDGSTWTYEQKLNKTAARTFSLTIDQKTYSNTKYKYITDEPNKPNWETRSGGGDRWFIYPLMAGEVVTGFESTIQEKTPPTISPSDQIHNAASVEVTITATEGDDIYYTVDTSDPKISSTRKKYTGPFTIPVGNTIVKTYAEKNFKESAEENRLYAVSQGTTQKWNFSVKNGNQYGGGSHDQSGIAISKNGEKVYRQTRTANAIGVFNASTGAFEKHLAQLSGFTPGTGGDVAVDSNGAIYACNAIYGGNLIVAKWENETATPSAFINTTAHNATGTKRIGYGMDVFVNTSGNGFLLMHKNTTDKLLYWEISNYAVKSHTPDSISITASPAFKDSHARISIVDANHFWIDGTANLPAYCTITRSGTYNKPSNVSAEYMSATNPHAYLNEGVGGATEFTFKGKRYGVFAVNNHETRYVWSGLSQHYSIIQEYKSTDTGATPTGPVIALFPPQGLGATTDASHFVESVVDIQDDKVLIYSMGGFNGTACYEFTEATVDSKFTPTGTALHFAQTSKIMDLSADYDLPDGAIAYYTTSKGLGSSPGEATTASTLYNENDKILLEEGVHEVNLLVTKPGYFSTYHSSTINVGPFVWKGGGTAWNTPSHWTINNLLDAVPSHLQAVRIPATPSVGNNFPVLTDAVAVGSVEIQSGAKITIEPEGSLKVHDGLVNASGTEGIYVKADPVKPTGSLLFDRTKSGNVQATVELYSRGEWTESGGKITNPKWQYFGIPFTEMTGIEHTFYGAIIREHNEASTTTNKWVQLTNSSTLSPKKGYEIAQLSPKKYVLSGTLYTGDFDHKVTYTSGVPYAGQNIISNPYLAAIPVSQIDFGNNENMDKAVYVYNTGRLSDWTGGHANDGTSAGQYLSIPKETGGQGGIPAEIAPMQGFLVRTAQGVSSAGSFSINYNQLVRNTAIQRTPKAPKPWLRLTLEAENSGDVMWLFAHPETTRGFDNGWDGLKMGGDAGTPMLFSHNETGNYQINAMEDIDETAIAFRASNRDTEYTINFNHGGGIMGLYSNIYFEDKETGEIVDITDDGASYSFISSNQNLSSRFRITTSPATQTGMQDVYVYSDNSSLYINNASLEDSTIELFDVVGRKVISYHSKAGEMQIEHPNIPRGSYVVRITNSKISSKKVVVGN